jgi:hypothetical protein
MTAPVAPLAFDILLGGERVGRHAIEFRERGDEILVDVRIAIDVRFAFVTLYRYRHSNREVWREGRLVALATATDDNGTKHRVSATATARGLVVNNGGSGLTAPATILPTSYWHPETVMQGQLLDTQHGRIVEVRTTPAGVDTVVTASGPVDGRRYLMRGDLDLDLWYTPAHELAGLAFDSRGGRVAYRRADSAADGVHDG